MSIIRRICFILLGITSVATPQEPLNIARLISGAFIGLFIGFIATSFYRIILFVFNPKLNKTLGQKEIKRIVNTSMVFLIPFTFMSFIAAFFLHWNINGAFLSIALMTVGIVASSELEKSIGKAKFKNTIITTVLSGFLATLWLMILPFVQFVPSYLVSGIKLIQQFMNGGIGL